jgi:putative redox protein
MHMDATVVWTKGLSFTGTGHSTGFTLPLGADPSVGGNNDGFRPTELILVALAGCTAMDVVSIHSKKRQAIASFEVKAHGERAPQDPKAFTSFLVEYVIRGEGINPDAVERAVELSEEKYCSVMATLRHAGPVERKITILPA